MYIRIIVTACLFVLMLLCIVIVLLILFAISIDLSTSSNVSYHQLKYSFGKKASLLQPNVSLNVSFHQSSYSVNEDQLLQPHLILNKQSSTDITVLIKSIDITATGKYINIIINNMFTY